MKKEQITNKKTIEGTVVSDKMTDTCVVLVKRYVKAPKYGKYILRSKKYKADDKGNTKKVGDTAVIVPCRPVSKDKRFKVIA